MDLGDHVFWISISFHVLMFSINAKEILFPARKCAEITKEKKERIVSFNFSIPIITILNYLHTCFRDERRLEISSEINVADGLNNPWAFVVKKVTAIINIKDILFSIGDLFNDYLENFYVYFYIYNCITPSLEVVAYILTSHFLCSTFLYTAEIEERPRRSVVYY